MRETLSISWSLSVKGRPSVAATLRPIAVLPAPIRPTKTTEREPSRKQVGRGFRSQCRGRMLMAGVST